ncbi:MAG: glycosyltransferase [Anaerolineales bacterium]|nr:glycosyltransferase [Anaerolineales bacterium]
MHVVQLIDKLGLGGAEALQATFAEAAQAAGLRVTVIGLKEVPGRPLPGRLRELGAAVHFFPAPKLADPVRFWQLTDFLRRAAPDVIQAHLTQANILGALAGRLTGLPVVATLHSTGIEPRHRNSAAWWLETQALRHGAQQVVAVGNQVAQAHRDRLRPRTPIVIPNAVAPVPPLDAAERLALRRHLLGDPARPMVIAVGRLVVPKAYPDLLAAFAQIRGAHPTAALVIVGDGDLRPALTAQIETLGLAGQVFLLGARFDVPRLLRASDLFVNSSHWEGLSVALLEAMAAGLPVVATAVGDAPQALADGAGLITPPGDPAQLAAALSALLRDPARREALGQAAAQRARQHYSPAVWLQRLIQVYQAAGADASARRAPAAGRQA